MARPQSPLAVRTKERGRTIAAPLADSSVGWRHVDSCGKSQQRIELNADKAHQIPLGQSPKIGTRYECYVSCDSCWSSQQFSEQRPTSPVLQCAACHRVTPHAWYSMHAWYSPMHAGYSPRVTPTSAILRCAACHTSSPFHISHHVALTLVYSPL